MDFNADLYGFVENMEISDELDATSAVLWALCGETSDPTPLEAVPRDDWFDPPEETPPQYTPLAATGLTLEQLLEDLRADLVAPLVYPQQSFLQPGPMHWETQVRS